MLVSSGRADRLEEMYRLAQGHLGRSLVRACLSVIPTAIRVRPGSARSSRSTSKRNQIDLHLNGKQAARRFALSANNTAGPISSASPTSYSSSLRPPRPPPPPLFLPRPFGGQPGNNGT